MQTQLASSPMTTMVSLLADAVSGLPQGLPPRWRSAVRSAVPPDARETLDPMFHRGKSNFPDCLSGATFGLSAHEQIERIADTTTTVLLEQLHADYAGTPPAHWQSVLDAPRRWLDRYVRLLYALWGEFEPTWRQAGALLDREAERVGAAVVRGGLDVILSGINSRWRFADGTFFIPDAQPTLFEQAGRPLVLVPVVSGVGASVFSCDLPDVIWIGYPLPGLGRLWDGLPSPTAADHPLVHLLGSVRAAILRFVGNGETMGTVASAVGCSPATVTHHCSQLEAAGLVVRQRLGNQVRVRRTARGEALLDLFC